MREQGLQRSESPDGTVKRIHNGNTTLLSFSSVQCLRKTAPQHCTHNAPRHQQQEIPSKKNKCTRTIYSKLFQTAISFCPGTCLVDYCWYLDSVVIIMFRLGFFQGCICGVNEARAFYYHRPRLYAISTKSGPRPCQGTTRSRPNQGQNQFTIHCYRYKTTVTTHLNSPMSSFQDFPRLVEVGIWWRRQS